MKIIIIILLTIISFCSSAQTAFKNETSFKDYWRANGITQFEGIYETTGASGIEQSKYAILKNQDSYQIILLYCDPIWTKSFGDKAGDIQGTLNPTAKSNLFKGNKLNSGNKRYTNIIIEFEDGLAKYINTDDQINLTWIKLYPTANDLNILNLETPKKVSGSGFALSTDGIIVTNLHVVEGFTSIKVRGVGSNFSRSYKASIIASDFNNDLALIKIQDPDFISFEKIPYSVKTNLATVGESIFVLGYPLRATMGEEIKLTNGIISSRTGFQGNIALYQVSASVQPGNSGGPLFDNQGNLIGIINAKHYGAENVSYAIKSTYLTNLIESLLSPMKLPSLNSLAGKSLSSQVEIIKKFVYIIEAE